MYATQDKIFEAFVGIAGDLTMNYDEYVLNAQKFVEDSPWKIRWIMVCFKQNIPPQIF